MTPNYDDPQVFYDDPQVHYDVSAPSPRKMSDKKKTYPVNEVLGFIANAKQMVTDKKTAMIANKVDPTDIIAALDTAHNSLTAENAAQEGLKTDLHNQTLVVDGVKSSGYDLASQACDQVISAFGRTSEEAAEATRLRKGVRPAPRRAVTPPPTP